MDAEPEQLHVVFAIDPPCRIVVVLGCDLVDQAYLMRPGACSARLSQYSVWGPAPEKLGKPSEPNRYLVP
jgi:hypothetical protein